MITYEPFWATMKKKKITKYQLIYHWGISSNTLRRISHGETINLTTLNELCLILNCKVSDIIKFEATEDEVKSINERREQISALKKKPKK